jgi:hypothetical protein
MPVVHNNRYTGGTYSRGVPARDRIEKIPGYGSIGLEILG